MRPICLLSRRFLHQSQRYVQKRQLLTLAIETSCDDTSVAVLEKHENGSAILHFDGKVTSDNRLYGGVYPIVAHESHQQNIATLVQKALKSLPVASAAQDGDNDAVLVIRSESGRVRRKKPDFITATLGPGMRASLITGVDTAKGLAVAWQIPFLGVNHMQAHALTPRMVSAVNKSGSVGVQDLEHAPAFPFLTLLVSGGHTMLVHSKSLCNHQVLSNTVDIAIGDMIDKSARDILPTSLLEEAPNVMYGPVLEEFAFPKQERRSFDESTEQYIPSPTKSTVDPQYDWSITAPYARSGRKGASSNPETFTFSGIGSSVKRIAELKPYMGDSERRDLAKEAMRVGFEHLASRVLLALKDSALGNISTLVVSGGVASNQYLKYVLRTMLDDSGHDSVTLNFPPPTWCTDNAAMIAWTGIEMYEEGYRTNLSTMAVRKWSIDPAADDGGILGLSLDRYERVEKLSIQ